MTDMRKVFALSAGQYSDYNVRMVFESSEEAEATRTKIDPQGHNDYYVEEFDFIPAGQTAPTRVVYLAAWSSNRDDIDVRDHIELGSAEPFHNPAKRHDSYAVDGSYTITASGTDRERVVKSVADKRAECLARRAEIS